MKDSVFEKGSLPIIRSSKDSIFQIFRRMYALNDIVLLRIFVFRIITKIMDYIQFHMKKIPISIFLSI